MGALGPDEFRLLTVTPASEAAECYTCSLDNFSFSSPSLPPYVVLSYAWSEPLPKHEPTNDKDRRVKTLAGHRIFETAEITTLSPALAVALDYVLAHLIKYWEEYDPEKQKIRIWVDYLCIHQADAEEKGQQVAKITDILSHAKRVIAWLGLPEDESAAEATMGLSQQLEEMIHELKQEVGDGTFVDKLLQRLDVWPDRRSWNPEVWRGIESLLRKVYWSRSWILQEAASPCGTTLLWGIHDVPVIYVEFMTVLIMKFQDYPKFSADYIFKFEDFDNISNLQRVRKRVKETPSKSTHRLSLGGLLEALRRADCSDKRDKIYAISGLAFDHQVQPIYGEKTVDDIYFEIVCQLLDNSGLEDLLSYAIHPYSEIDEEVIVPVEGTWIPNWSYRIFNVPFSHFGCAAGRTTNATSTANPKITDRTLQVRGFKLQSLEKVSVIHPAGLMMPHIMEQWQHLVSDAQHEHTQEDMDFAFKRTVIGNEDEDRKWFVEDSGVNFDLYRRSTDELDPDMFFRRTHFRYDPKHRCANRQFGVTTSGLIGLFPAVAEAGDDICIFEGCGPCYVLRPKAGEEMYEFVGECYVHGVMQAEALTDKYPQHKDLVDFYIV